MEASDLWELPSDTVLISINEEHGDLYTLKVSGSRVLRVKFSDVCQRETNAGIGKTGLVFNPIDTKTVKEILDFIEEYKGQEFIIHCAAGVSRSGAVAMFLHLMYGYDLKENYYSLSEANPFVLGRLIFEYKKKQYKNAKPFSYLN